MKKILLLAMTLFTVFTISGCVVNVTTNYTIDQVEDNIAIIYASGDDENHVTQDVTLPRTTTFISNAFIFWVSDTPDVISHTGVVTQDTNNHTVTLTYTLSYNDESRTGSFVLTVLGLDPTIEDIEAALEIGYVSGDSAQHVSQNLTLPTVSTLDLSATISWVSSNPSIITNTGIITRQASNETVTLTYTISYDGGTLSDTIMVVVIAAAEQYTVTFNSNGGSAVSSITQDEGTSITKPTDPTKDGYTFVAWYVDQALTTSYVFGTTLTADITLYARWDEYIGTDFTGIYDGAEDKTGATLISFLYNVVTTGISGSTQDYGDARYTLDDTDEDPSNPSNVILVYLGTSVSGTWDGGITWNREHVWPQSLLGEEADNNTVNMASDLHNLKPANPSANSSRGNKWFGSSTTTVSYAPRVDVRGDIARILFYMAVRYHSTLTLVNLSGLQEPSVHQMGDLATLLQWHLADPVDTFEMNRNDRIASVQGNRNPFIDYPEFADLIW